MIKSPALSFMWQQVAICDYLIAFCSDNTQIMHRYEGQKWWIKSLMEIIMFFDSVHLECFRLQRMHLLITWLQSIRFAVFGETVTNNIASTETYHKVALLPVPTHVSEPI